MLRSLAAGMEVKVAVPAPARCEHAHLVDSYVWRCLGEGTQRVFELHLMECGTCLLSVELERLLRRAIREHKTSCGTQRVTRVRRIR